MPRPPISPSALPPLVLASTSRYRRELLDRLGWPFEVIAPGIEERADPDESASDTALRLAREKARAVSVTRPDAVVIGSDQVAVVDGTVLGKPGSLAAATAQLHQLGGRRARFETAVCVRAPDGRERHSVTLTTADFRPLDPAEIARYLQREAPFDCAGSFKAEALGITLLDALSSDDPTAIIGLPLIAVRRHLAELGWPLPGALPG